MNKYLFLDVDGPLIPDTSFLFHSNASYDQIFDERCVAVVKKVLDDSGAWLVMNTTHNLHWEPDRIAPGLKPQLHKCGLGKYLHKSPRTIYPELDRLTAIMKWMNDNADKHDLWVAFDDAPIDHKRAYRTSESLGVGIGEYNHAQRLLMFKRK